MGHVVAFGKQEELFQKYCGKAIIILENTSFNQQLIREYNHLEAPDHLIAISCKDHGEEERLVSLLIQHDVNFKRSNNDIEIMSINAKKQFKQEDTEYEAV